MCCTTSHVTGPAVDFAPLPEGIRLRFAEAVVNLAHDAQISWPTALQWLAAAHLTADDTALEDALVSLQIRDGLLAGFLDPYDLMEVAPSVAHEKAVEFAVGEYETRVRDALRVLARPGDVRGARAVVTASADAVLAGAR